MATLSLGIIVAPIIRLAAQSESPKSTAQTRIERIVLAEIKKQGIPGISVAVLNKRQVVFSKAYGMADVENHVPVTTRTRFRTASVAKPITATAAAILWQQGKLDLDVPVQRYCSAFPKNPGRLLRGSCSGI